MKIMSYLTGTAIALAVSVGSASAAEQFSTMEGLQAQAMTPQAMGVVTGMAATLRVSITGTGPAAQAPVTDKLFFSSGGTAGLNTAAVNVTRVFAPAGPSSVATLEF